MIGILLSAGIFIVIVALVSYVVSNAIEDEKEFDRRLHAESKEVDRP